MSEVLKGQPPKMTAPGEVSSPSEATKLELPCRVVQSLLPAAIQGRLTDSLQLSIEDHLALCPTCQAEYEELSSLRDDLSWVMESQPSAPQGLWAKIEASINAEAREPASPYRLLESCLHLLISLGVPEWSIAPVIQTVALAEVIRQGQLPAPIDSLIGHLATG